MRRLLSKWLNSLAYWYKKLGKISSSHFSMSVVSVQMWPYGCSHLIISNDLINEQNTTCYQHKICLTLASLTGLFLCKILPWNITFLFFLFYIWEAHNCVFAHRKSIYSILDSYGKEVGKWPKNFRIGSSFKIIKLSSKQEYFNVQYRNNTYHFIVYNKKYFLRSHQRGHIACLLFVINGV